MVIKNFKNLIHNLSNFRNILLEKKYPIFLDYPVNTIPRYGYGKPAHPQLYDIINRNRDIYSANLTNFLNYKEDLVKIPLLESTESIRPHWRNNWIPGLDAVSIYGFLSINDPENYFEIGSGNSTKFARQAIKDHSLKTKITSFDPYPRAEIDLICDEIFRNPVEEIDISLFDKLEEGDILFVDNSHYILMNSDVTTVFLDILPNLNKGVLVEFHDIYLPLDYPPETSQSYNSEQYLLAAYLLANGNKFEIIFPSAFISIDPELNKILSPLWEDPRIKGIEKHGGSFWIKIK